MHDIEIRPEIIARVMARRGRLHLFEKLTPAKTALVVIDMQNTFLRPGAPVEVPKGREIVANINRLSARLRAIGVPVIWVTHANGSTDDKSDWPGFFDYFVAAEVRQKTIDGLAPGAEGQKIWPDLDVSPEDAQIFKNRYSALIAGSSSLESLLRRDDIDTLLIAGTKTNVCCESTARDAMMLDFNTVMLSDCCAALSDEEHRATLEIIIQQFGDVMTLDEALAALEK
ncbi:MAG: cysteine hydrolase [Proteobacteria bacterium]|nr:cysteine hydrolase [Pseudomonadota bacterium]MDA1357190.1 cysteine hydrolase [Pseudomonadota bacterium]